MAQQRRGLGKGLGALIPDAARPGAGSPAGAGFAAPAPSEAALRPVAGAYFEEVAVDSITPNPRQPRRTFDDDALDELAA